MAAWIYKGGQQYFKSGLRGSGSTLANTKPQYLLDFSATLAAGVGNNTASMNGILRAVMKGANLTSTATIAAAVHGVYWLTGTNASTWPKAAVVGEIHDSTTSADAAFVALIGGDSGATTATSAFAVRQLNSAGAASGFSYGLDLGPGAIGAFSTPQILTADIRFQSQATMVHLTTAITANVTATTLPVGSIGFTTHATGRGVTFYSDGAKWQTSIGQTLSQTSSQFMMDLQPTLAAGVGNNTGSAVGVLRGLMQGANLSSTAVTQGAIYGVYWLTGTNASTWPKAAVIGEIHDGTTTSDAAVMAVMGGDSGASTQATAAFGVRSTGSTPTNQFTYGLDLGGAIAGFTSAAQLIKTADIRFSKGGLLLVSMTTAVTANVTTTTAPAGSLGLTSNATGNATLWISDGAKWQKSV